jgi:acyl dehydratase
MRVFSAPHELLEVIGQDLGHSEWHEITQERVDMFAEATGDHQWIHVDPVRAAEGPFGATVAHGFLTLSMVLVLSREIYLVKGYRLGLNYGADRIRYPNVVRVGSRVRVHAHLADVTGVELGYRVTTRFAVEVEGEDKPAMVADLLVVYVS